MNVYRADIHWCVTSNNPPKGKKDNAHYFMGSSTPDWREEDYKNKDIVNYWIEEVFTLHKNDFCEKANKDYGPSSQLGIFLGMRERYRGDQYQQRAGTWFTLPIADLEKFEKELEKFKEKCLAVIINYNSGEVNA